MWQNVKFVNIYIWGKEKYCLSKIEYTYWHLGLRQLKFCRPLTSGSVRRLEFSNINNINIVKIKYMNPWLKLNKTL